MASPFPNLRQVFLPLAFSVTLLATQAITLPLPAPARPTSFPLTRPTQVGEVVAWGTNDLGQTSLPVGLTNIVAISAKYNHTLALRADGTVVAWGDNTYGQTNVPAGLSDVVAVSTGWYHSLALKSNGKVVAWGGDVWGITNVPPSLSDAVVIAAGADHSLALRANGTIVGWGNNDRAQTTSPMLDSNTPTTNVIAIAAGQFGSMALLPDERVVIWGLYGSYAGNPPTAIVQTPSIIEGAAIMMPNR